GPRPGDRPRALRAHGRLRIGGEHGRRGDDVHGEIAAAAGRARLERRRPHARSALDSSSMSRRDVLVLCYHGVHPAAEHGEVTPQAFRAQLEYLASHGYRWVTFSEAVLGDTSGRVAAVTFDDGIGSALEHGLPVLDELGIPGTMFPRLDTLDVA